MKITIMLGNDMLLYILLGELITLGVITSLILLEELRLRVATEKEEGIKRWLDGVEKENLLSNI